MKKKSIYLAIHLSLLLLPFLLILIGLINLLLMRYDENFSEFIIKFIFSSGVLAIVAFYGFLIFLIPYAVETLILWWWSRNKDERQIRKAILLSPVITAMFCIAFVIILGLVVGDVQETIKGLVGKFNNIALILFSYFVVRYALIGIGFLFTAILQKRKVKKQMNSV